MVYPFRKVVTSQGPVQADQALMHSLDEKSQIHALDRDLPLLPMRPETPGGQTHDDVRHGMTSLFAALDLATRQIASDLATARIIDACHQRQQHQAFLKVLQHLDAKLPPPPLSTSSKTTKGPR